MKIINISRALQGVHATAGVVYIRPGKSKDVDLTNIGIKQARRLKGILDIGKSKDVDTTSIGLKAEHHGGGKFNITEGETVHLSGLSKAEADAFNAMSEVEKLAFVETAKAKD